MKTRLIKLIENRQYASFVEINRHIPEFMGDLLWIFNNNIVLWHQCSDIAIDVISDLVNSKIIKALPDSEFIYLFDGKVAPFEVIKDINYQQKKYKWLPITFCMHDYSDRNGICFK